VLVALAGVLRDCRVADRTFHLGGDEFALLRLPQTLSA
jgi:GGDEF domain-containing protein